MSVAAPKSLKHSSVATTHGYVVRVIPHYLKAESSPADRKYTFAAYELKDDGRTLVVRTVNDKTVPATLKTSAALENAVRANLKNPALFNNDGATFIRPKAKTAPSGQASPSPAP